MAALAQLYVMRAVEAVRYDLPHSHDVYSLAVAQANQKYQELRGEAIH